MVRQYTWLIIIVALVGCGALPKRYVDPRFDSIIAEYLVDSHDHNLNTDKYSTIRRIEYGTLPNRIKGHCETNINKWEPKLNYRTITIAPNIQGFELKLILFHELSHCVFDAPHVADSEDIMNATPGQDIQFYEGEWTILVDNMLNRFK